MESNTDEGETKSLAERVRVYTTLDQGKTTYAFLVVDIFTHDAGTFTNEERVSTKKRRVVRGF